jgi:hypothetical protein
MMQAVITTRTIERHYTDLAVYAEFSGLSRKTLREEVNRAIGGVAVSSHEFSLRDDMLPPGEEFGIRGLILMVHEGKVVQGAALTPELKHVKAPRDFSYHHPDSSVLMYPGPAVNSFQIATIRTGLMDIYKEQYGEDYPPGLGVIPREPRVAGIAYSFGTPDRTPGYLIFPQRYNTLPMPTG